MPGSIHRLLAEDHRRLEDLLTRTAAQPERLDLEAYAQFRAGLLRHIGMEEKILIPGVQKARGGQVLPMASRLRLDHGALTALLVPPPSLDVIAALQGILSGHNALEEAVGGLYEVCDEWVGDRSEEFADKLRNAPYPPLKPHVSNPAVLEATRRALVRAGYNYVQRSDDDKR